jgi:hypothetical protein
MGPTHLVVSSASSHLTPVESSKLALVMKPLLWNLYCETFIVKPLSWNRYRETIIVKPLSWNHYRETVIVKPLLWISLSRIPFIVKPMLSVNTIVVKTDKKGTFVFGAYTVVVVPRASWIVALVWVREVQLCCELKACDFVASRLHVTLVWVVVVWLWCELKSCDSGASRRVVTLVRVEELWLWCESKSCDSGEVK